MKPAAHTRVTPRERGLPCDFANDNHKHDHESVLRDYLRPLESPTPPAFINKTRTCAGTSSQRIDTSRPIVVRRCLAGTRRATSHAHSARNPRDGETRHSALRRDSGADDTSPRPLFAHYELHIS